MTVCFMLLCICEGQRTSDPIASNTGDWLTGVNIFAFTMIIFLGWCRRWNKSRRSSECLYCQLSSHMKNDSLCLCSSLKCNLDFQIWTKLDWSILFIYKESITQCWFLFNVLKELDTNWINLLCEYYVNKYCCLNIPKGSTLLHYCLYRHFIFLFLFCSKILYIWLNIIYVSSIGIKLLFVCL